MKNRLEVIATIEMHERELVRLRAIDTGCQGCLKFGPRMCVEWKQPVPKEHQAAGCDKWEWDYIPF